MRTDLLRLNLDSFVIRECSYPPGLRMPRHAHDYSNVTIVISGSILEASEEGEHTGRSGSVVVKPAGCEHEDRVGGFGARTLSIQPVRGDDPLATRRWSWLERTEVIRAALTLRRSINARISPGPSIQRLMNAVLARDCPAPAPPPWFRAAKRTLDEHPDDTLRFEMIAGELGIHPVYLSRAFRRYAGVSMQEYRRTQRIRRACDLLASSNRSITAIACASGFTDPSHLSHTFHELLGVTPGNYRRLCQQA